MTASDFRIGNCVIVNHKTDVRGVVTSIQAESITVEFAMQPDLTTGMICCPEKIIGVPLTKNILFRTQLAEIDKDLFSDANETSSIYVNVWGEDIDVFIASYHGQSWFPFKKLEHIKSVHQLQNLFKEVGNIEITVR